MSTKDVRTELIKMHVALEVLLSVHLMFIFPNYLVAMKTNMFKTNFDVLLTVHLSIFILVINQLNAQHFVLHWKKFCASSWLITRINVLNSLTLFVSQNVMNCFLAKRSIGIRMWAVSRDFR